VTSSKFTFIDLFAGIGGIRLGFESVGGKCVFSSEIDKFACKTYEANFSEIPSGDITKIEAKDIPPFEVLCAGFPCQPFSRAGIKKGFHDTRGTMFWHILRIVSYHKPKVIFLENVAGLYSHDKGYTFNVIKVSLFDMGYHVKWKLLNSKYFGVAQSRLRIYIVATRIDDDLMFSFPKEGSIESVHVSSILESCIDPKYTISDKLWSGHQKRKLENKKSGKGFGFGLISKDSTHTRTLTARYYKDGSEALVEQEGKNPRKLTPRECLRLQGFPEWFITPVSDTQAYKQIGNSVAVPVIQAIAYEIIKTLLD